MLWALIEPIFDFFRNQRCSMPFYDNFVFFFKYANSSVAIKFTKLLKDTCYVVRKFERAFDFRKETSAVNKAYDISNALTCTIWIFSSKAAIFSSKASCRVDISDTISYTVFCVFAMSVIVFALSISFRWSILTLRKLCVDDDNKSMRQIGSISELTHKWPAETSFDVFAPGRDSLASLTLCVYKWATSPEAHSPLRFWAVWMNIER